MSLHYRTVQIAAVVCGLMSLSSKTFAADLRTSACDRPVCRTVAIVPEPAAKPGTPAPMGTPVPQALSTEEVFDEYGGDCHGSCAYGCQTCCFPKRDMWAEADFLLGWRHSIRFPPLVTTSPNGTAEAAAGVLPGATVLYPTEPIGEEARPGARFSLGVWLDPCHRWGLEGRYFMLADETTTFSLQSDGDPILARPFFDVLNNAEASRLLAFPGVVSPGGISILTESQLLGGDALLRRKLCNWGCGEMDFLVGYQFARLDETLSASDFSTDVDPGNLIQDGTIFAITDSASTRNQYHAATIGAAARMQRDCLKLDILGKIGFGNMRETVTVAGSTTITVPGAAPVVNADGLLAQGNLGTFTQDKFCVSPEINAKLIYQVNRCVDVSCGYTFIYYTSVAQPGEQIDPSLLVPPENTTIRSTEYWMHGFQCGVAVRF